MSIVSFAYKQADFTNRFHPPRFTALFLISTHFLVPNSRFSNKNCSRQIPADYSLFSAVPTIKKIRYNPPSGCTGSYFHFLGL